jgi:hypothetical protein
VKVKPILWSVLPSTILSGSVILLALSGLTISQAITLQVDTVKVFWQTLARQDVLIALVDVALFIFYRAVLPLLPFMFTAVTGSLTLYSIRQRINRPAHLLILITFLAVTLMWAGLSILILLTCLGTLAVSVYVMKFFKPRDTPFGTARALISQTLRALNVLLSVGLFLTLYLNLSAYRPVITKTNLDLVMVFLPARQIEGMTVSYVNLTAEVLKRNIAIYWQQVPSPAREQCQPLYEAVMAGIDRYKEEVGVQNVTATAQQLIELLPLMEYVVNLAPLYLALLFFSLLELIKPFVTLLGGFVVWLAHRLTRR